MFVLRFCSSVSCNSFSYSTERTPIRAFMCLEKITDFNMHFQFFGSSLNVSNFSLCGGTCTIHMVYRKPTRLTLCHKNRSCSFCTTSKTTGAAKAIYLVFVKSFPFLVWFIINTTRTQNTERRYVGKILGKLGLRKGNFNGGKLLSFGHIVVALWLHLKVKVMSSLVKFQLVFLVFVVAFCLAEGFNYN